ncbi:DsbA family oxidoreductase [Alicyclobacillus acidiphilus]|jgi:predicted DsbA family dithiol-disulfide isomerase|uniref:DsbA family oxidoreductase n=1 Tax=Alicyclobacillus acidiphilus TaxID=182455 RepID=UPI00082A0030|nr:DsbA family oxidoreductase [Alicyclobacillus acidiphilus]
MNELKIDIYQDTVCPWCRIGQAHLMQALRKISIEPLEINYKAFLLDPTTPPEGRPRSTLIEKLGGQQRSDEMHNRLCKIGEACGVEFHFEEIERIPNTLLSHQLIKLTPHDKQRAMVDALHDAYFEQGLDIGQMDVLLDIAKSQGLDPVEVKGKLLAEEQLPEVERDLAFAEAANISGVPFFVINDTYGISGAQPVDVFVQALTQIAETT